MRQRRTFMKDGAMRLPGRRKSGWLIDSLGGSGCKVELRIWEVADRIGRIPFSLYLILASHVKSLYALELVEARRTISIPIFSSTLCSPPSACIPHERTCFAYCSSLREGPRLVRKPSVSPAPNCPLHPSFDPSCSCGNAVSV